MKYLISELPLGAWVNHLTGAVLMLSSQIFSCMAPFGLAIDADNPPGTFYATRYIRFFLDPPGNLAYTTVSCTLQTTYQIANEIHGDLREMKFNV